MGPLQQLLNCNQQNLVELQPLFGGLHMVIKRHTYGDLMGFIYIYIYWDILEIKWTYNTL